MTVPAKQGLVAHRRRTRVGSCKAEAHTGVGGRRLRARARVGVGRLVKQQVRGGSGR